MEYNRNLTRTENGALAYRSTGSNLLDLFSMVGVLRDKSESEIESRFNSALEEDMLLGVKLMFYARNIRGGLGERRTFRVMLRSLAKSNPQIVIKNMPLIAEFGRYDDYYTLIGTEAENAMWYFLRECFSSDIRNMYLNKPVSLCAKWLKSVNTSSEESSRLGRLTAKMLGLSEKAYRINLSKLRAYIKVTETKMSSNEWEEIEYSAVPSRAMKNYRKAFGRHDPVGFSNFIGNVEKGVEKINASTLYPYDIMRDLNLREEYGYGYSKIAFAIDRNDVLEALWKALPNYVQGEHNVLVMADTSGSMDGFPMYTSVGLALYFAERNRGAYKDMFMTFSSSPKFVLLKGESLREKVSCIEAIVANTNLEKAFDLILDVAIKNNVPQEEMPKALVVVSDMHFDYAVDGSKTFHIAMKEKFERRGYTMPTVIYWNVDERAQVVHAKANEQGVVLVSGYSTTVFKSILNSIAHTPMEMMLEILNSKEYDVVKI